MKVGLFDHVEQTGDRSLATIFDERLRFAQLADEAGSTACMWPSIIARR
jgi:hypothetical protein